MYGIEENSSDALLRKSKTFFSSLDSLILKLWKEHLSFGERVVVVRETCSKSRFVSPGMKPLKGASETEILSSFMLFKNFIKEKDRSRQALLGGRFGLQREEKIRRSWYILVQLLRRSTTLVGLMFSLSSFIASRSRKRYRNR